MKTMLYTSRPLLIFLSVLFAGCSAPSPKLPDSAVRIEKSDELAAQALQEYFRKNSVTKALQLLQKATKSSPKRADLLWLNFELCAQVLECNSEAIEAQLLKLDPGNGAIRLGALARAQRAGDATAERGALDSLARSQNFQIYWNSVLSKLSRATVIVGPKRPQPVTRSLNEVTEWYSKLSSPTFGPILEACSEVRVAADNSVRARCIRVSQLLQQSDTYIAESVGLSLAQQLSNGGELVQKILERGNALKEEREAAVEIINGQLDREKLSTELIELMAKVPREQDMFLALLRFGGATVEPER